MKNMQRLLLTIIITSVITTTFPCYYASGMERSQKKAQSRDRIFTEVGVITGFGSGKIPEGDYQPVFLIGHFGIDLKKYFSKLQNHRGQLSLFFEPQINTIMNPETDFECGIGIGIKYSYPFTDKVSAYAMGSVGPHYISVVTKEQANELLFSDVIGIGLYYYLSQNSAINAGYRFRHLSNADLAKPNGGIDTHIGVIGYSVFFD